MMGVAVSNVLLGTVGFTISGCLAPENRWRHLGLVGLGAWLVGLVNVAFFGITLTQWAVGFVFLAVMIATGGGLSLLLRRTKQNGTKSADGAATGTQRNLWLQVLMAFLGAMAVTLERVLKMGKP